MSDNEDTESFLYHSADDLKPVETFHGIMSFDPSDGPVGRSLFSYHEWARLEIEFVLAFITPGCVVLDVGANIGTHTLAFARAVGRQGTVFSFEPQNFICNVLEENVKRNGLTNVQVFRKGVSATKGKAYLASDENASRIVNSGSVQLVVEDTTKAGDVVEVISIDSLKLEECALIKIDVEGLEVAVLAGATDLIHDKRPVVIAECNSVIAGIHLVRAALEWDDYSLHLLATRAFNAGNVASNVINIFPGAWETSILFVPEEQVNRLPAEQDGVRVWRIESVEAFSEVFVDSFESSLSEAISIMHSDLDSAHQDVERLRVTQQELRVTQQEIVELRGQLGATRVELEEATRVIMETQVALSEVLGSTSWRVTLPLRKMKGIMRG